MANYISKITFPDGVTTYNLKDSYVWDWLNNNASGVLSYKGETSTELSDGSTATTIQIGSSSITATNGNVVVYGSKEFVYCKTKPTDTGVWHEFGDISNLGEFAKVDQGIFNYTPSGDLNVGYGDTDSNKILVSTSSTQVVTGVTITGNGSASLTGAKYGQPHYTVGTTSFNGSSLSVSGSITALGNVSTEEGVIRTDVTGSEYTPKGNITVNVSNSDVNFTTNATTNITASNTPKYQYDNIQTDSVVGVDTLQTKVVTSVAYDATNLCLIVTTGSQSTEESTTFLTDLGTQTKTPVRISAQTNVAISGRTNLDAQLTDLELDSEAVTITPSVSMSIDSHKIGFQGTPTNTSLNGTPLGQVDVKLTEHKQTYDIQGGTIDLSGIDVNVTKNNVSYYAKLPNINGTFVGNNQNVIVTPPHNNLII